MMHSIIDPQAHECGHPPVEVSPKFKYHVIQPSGYEFDMRASEWLMDTLYGPTGATYHKISEEPC